MLCSLCLRLHYLDFVLQCWSSTTLERQPLQRRATVLLRFRHWTTRVARDLHHRFFLGVVAHRETIRILNTQTANACWWNSPQSDFIFEEVFICAYLCVRKCWSNFYVNVSGFESLLNGPSAHIYVLGWRHNSIYRIYVHHSHHSASFCANLTHGYRGSLWVSSRILCQSSLRRWFAHVHCAIFRSTILHFGSNWNSFTQKKKGNTNSFIA